MEKKWLVVALGLMAMAACNSVPKSPAEATVAPTDKASAQPHLNGQAKVGDGGSIYAKGATSDVATVGGAMAAEVFFDFDKAEVKPAFRKLLKERAIFLKQHGEVMLTLEGNADERGSREYNLALGEKRAMAVRDALVALGVTSARIKIVSLGESAPRLTCSAEQCWKENRRVDFVERQES